ncbi:MAG TPA: AAA family ATPase [Fibrobacteria bacterium]|nr:AAA family ATPase [Fibrobacteria bacterium]
MFRHINGFLQNWWGRPDRKPLLLRGPRQVGKTWAARALADAVGTRLIEINFELQPECKLAFSGLAPDQILKSLSLLGFPMAEPGKHLLFLDEIQECPQAIAALRYFYELMPRLAVLGTGSLLEFALEQERFSMPVGRIESAWLHPMSLGEFLRAKGNPGLAEAVEADPLGNPLPEAAHLLAFKELREYLFCGGMPQAVLAMTMTRDAESVRRAHRSILQTYRQDFYKYAPKIKAHLAESLFLKAPGLVGGRFKYSHVDPGLRASEIKPAVEALEKAGVIRRVIHASGQGAPLAVDANPRLAKLIFLDVGLMHASLQIDAQLVQAPDLLGVHRGAVAEQFTGQELLACAPPDREPELYFWVREALNSQAEVDYLIASGSKVLPIEVKSGASGTLKSLHSFLGSHPNSPAGVRLYSGRAMREEKVIHLPLYAAGAVRACLQNR